MPSSSSQDAHAIAEVLAGRTHRFEEIVHRYESALLRVAESRLGRRGLAEEAVQETFLCAFKSLHTYDSRYSFRTWLWTILLNQCRRQYHKSRRGPTVHSCSGEEAQAALLSARDQGQPGPESAAIQQEQSQWLETLLGDLPSPQADALRLRFFGGLKYQEIADAMSCSLSAAKQRVRLGLAKLSQQIQQTAESKSSRSGESI